MTDDRHDAELDLDSLFDTIEDRLPDTPFQRFLGKLNACDDARTWVGAQDLATAWANCRECSWMSWLLDAVNTSDMNNHPLFECCSGCWLQKEQNVNIFEMPLGDRPAVYREFFPVESWRKYLPEEFRNV